MSERILLDTSVLLYWTLDPARLSYSARQELDAADIRLVLTVSLWEIALKASRSRLELPLETDVYRSRLERVQGLDIVPLDAETAVHGARLDWDHPDPVDRWIVACAHRLHVPLLTSDATIRAFSSRAVW
jgi:PIN domain nuclease of toxin-antitoxin system